MQLGPIVEIISESHKMALVPEKSLNRLASAMESEWGRNRFRARVISWDCEKFSSIVGERSGPEAFEMWRAVLLWDAPPPSVIEAFYLWSNEMNKAGFEYEVANVVSSGPRPKWLDIERLENPARSLIE
jgi:hypothetical protein